MGVACGDALTCFRKHHHSGAVQSNCSRLGVGNDLDEALIVASTQDFNKTRTNTAMLSFSCFNLPNLDTFSRTDGMCILYKKKG